MLIAELLTAYVLGVPRSRLVLAPGGGWAAQPGVLDPVAGRKRLRAFPRQVLPGDVRQVRSFREALLLRAFERWEQYRLGTNIRAWLFTIASREAIALIRKNLLMQKTGQAFLKNRPFPDPATPAELTETGEIKRLVGEAVACVKHR